MTATPTTEILAGARAERYAVAAVNIVDDLSMRAVCRAAADDGSPLIVQTSVKTVRSLGSEFLATSFRLAAESVSVPVALHLDHCPDRGVISECLAAGWNSVLFDASDRELAAARRETMEVVAEAHAVGASVESEIENIAGVEDEVGADGEGARYPVELIVDFVTATGCDFFAPAVGTAHGMYIGEPTLDPGRAGELADRLGIPLVLHGGTGLTDAQFTEFIAAGCAKINLSTTLKRTYLQSALMFLERARAADRWDPPSLFTAVDAAVADDVATHLRLFGSAGRSAP